MSKNKKDPDNPHVTRTFCDERFGQFSTRVYETLDSIDDKVNGIDKKVDNLKEKQLTEKEQQARDWRLWLLSIGSGACISLVTLVLAYLL